MNWGVPIMRSKTSYFDSMLFRKTLTRFWPVWFAYAFVWLVVLPLPLGSDLARVMSSPNFVYSDTLYTLQYSPLNVAVTGGLSISLIFCCISATCVFSHLYSSRASGAYAVLPIRREGAFISVALAGILPLLLSNVIVFLVSLLTEVASGAVFLPALLTWLGAVSLIIITFFGIASLCAQLTGNIIVLPLVYLVLNFAAAAVEFLSNSLLESLVFGFTSRDMFLTFLSPGIQIAYGCSISPHLENDVVTSYSFNGWGTLLSYAAVGLVFLAAALGLYRRRRMETAGDVVAVNCLKPVFKYCMAFGCALLAGILLLLTISSINVVELSGLIYLVLFMLLGAFIGYFASEMLIHKSYAVFRGGRRWLGLGVVCILCAAAVFSWEFDLFGYERRVPEVDDIESVSARVYGGNIMLELPEDIALATQLHRNIISHKAIHEASREDLTIQSVTDEELLTSSSEIYAKFNLTYYLKDGSRLSRAYSLSGWTTDDGHASDSIGDLYALQSLMNLQPHLEARTLFDFEVNESNISFCNVDYNEFEDNGDVSQQRITLTVDEALELYYDCIVPDVKDGNMGKLYIITDSQYERSVYSSHITLSVYSQDSRGEYLYDSPSFTPTIDSARTNAWLLEHGVTQLTIAETYRGRLYGDMAVPAYVG